jgi:Mg-chelatase subunit ChlD
MVSSSNGSTNSRLHVKVLLSARSTDTSQYSIHSTRHGRQRRYERGIRVRQLQKAMKYGKRQQLGRGRSKYVYNGIVFIMDDKSQREVTSYSIPFDIPLRIIPSVDLAQHMEAKKQIELNGPNYCTSHAVLIVDMSGSMRNSDVIGARTRLAAVWYSLARDFIQSRIESGQAGLKDALSVVLMRNDATLHPVLHNVPTTWKTYNEFMTIYKEGTLQPGGHGCFQPAIQLAEKILMRYESSDCTLILAILSDGKPSDHTMQRTSYLKGCSSIVERIGTLCSTIGNRLTVSAIGIGSADQFTTLQQMTARAKDYGSHGTFAVPSLSTSGIGAAISSVATSLTDSQMSVAKASGIRRKIHSVQREDRRKIPMVTEEVSPDDFYIFMNSRVQHKM